MLKNETVFDDQDLYDVIAVDKKPDKLTLTVASRQQGSNCPCCGKKSISTHSYYTRILKDLPILDKETWIHLKARKFYCTNKRCARQVFTERFDIHFKPGKRMTERVQSRITKIALHMGGNGGEKICRLMNIPVSGSTLLRAIHDHKISEIVTPKVLGIDDWAYKKRLTYGTVLVDMEKRKIIDLLPDRESKTVENWLKAHPGVKIVTRDRYSNFANGVKNAGGSIVQVADRWHLVKNLGDVIQKILVRNYNKLKQARSHEIVKLQNAHTKVVAKSKMRSPATEGKLQRKFNDVKFLLEQGRTIRSISVELNVSRFAIRKWKTLDEYPKKRAPARTNINGYEAMVRSMIAADPRVETKEIWREIKAAGYNGKQSAAYAQIGRIKGKKQKQFNPKLPAIFWLPHRTSILFYKERDELSKKENQLLVYLCKKSEEIRMTAAFVREFKTIMKSKKWKCLKPWINRAIASQINEFRGFAQSLLTDFDAVKNAIRLPWSNGPVEGQVNKLKTIKRQMYGRASFNLLRKRLICG